MKIAIVGQGKSAYKLAEAILAIDGYAEIFNVLPDTKEAMLQSFYLSAIKGDKLKKSQPLIDDKLKSNEEGQLEKLFRSASKSLIENHYFDKSGSTRISDLFNVIYRFQYDPSDSSFFNQKKSDEIDKYQSFDCIVFTYELELLWPNLNEKYLNIQKVYNLKKYFKNFEAIEFIKNQKSFSRKKIIVSGDTDLALLAFVYLYNKREKDQEILFVTIDEKFDQGNLLSDFGLCKETLKNEYQKIKTDLKKKWIDLKEKYHKSVQVMRERGNAPDDSNGSLEVPKLNVQRLLSYRLVGFDCLEDDQKMFSSFRTLNIGDPNRSGVLSKDIEFISFEFDYFFHFEKASTGSFLSSLYFGPFDEGTNEASSEPGLFILDEEKNIIKIVERIKTYFTRNQNHQEISL